MNNNNLYANLKAYADLKRNPFPLHHSHTYAQKLGEITPLKCIHTLPGDFYQISMNDKSLSFPMNTPAFIGARKELVAYHVPYNHVCSLFNQMQASRPDPKTSALVNQSDIVGGEKNIAVSELYLPTVTQFIGYLLTSHVAPVYGGKPYNHYSVESDTGGIIFQYEDKNGEGRQFTFMNCLPLSTDSYDISIFIDDMLGDFSNLYDILHRFRAYNWVKKLDMLGYGNLYPLFKETEKVFEYVHGKHRDYKELLRSSGLVPDYDEFDSDEITALSCAINSLIVRVYQLCFAGSEVTETNGFTDISVTSPRYLSLYPILAYNKVFYEFFRNTYYDNDYNVKDYNIDFLYGIDGQEPTPLFSHFDLRFLDIEYHQYKKDIFTGGLPSAQFGAVSALTLNSVAEGLTTNNSTYGGVNDGQAAFIDQNLVDVNGRPSRHTHALSLQVDSRFDVLQLKRAEMLQDYRQTLLRNGNKTSDIFKGIYGSSPASEDDNSPRFLDAFGSNIFVDTVVSTAETSSENNGSLGSLGARSTISAGGSFKFKTSDFGCLLFLSYIVPENMYGSTMFDECLLANDPESHFLPFFQNLGFQPVYNHNLNAYLMRERNTDLVRVYSPSYYQHKQQLSLAHGNFVSLTNKLLLPNDKQGQTPDQNVRRVLYDAGFFDDYVGSFNHWVALNNAIQNSSTTTLAQFYVSPSMWDNIFVQKAGADDESAHFICHVGLSIKSVRVLSKLGLPNF